VSAERFFKKRVEEKAKGGYIETSEASDFLLSYEYLRSNRAGNLMESPIDVKRNVRETT
jgi:hypothetical protein